MIAVAVASEALMAKLDENKADLAKLADPRTIKLTTRWRTRSRKRAAPVYYITGTIHSTEAGAPTALMELAYRLAVDESPYVRNIREHLITLITPVVEVDGRDRIVDAYEWRKKHPKETPMSNALLGQVRRARQQPRRDGADAQAVAERARTPTSGGRRRCCTTCTSRWRSSTTTPSATGPYNAWLDPILTNEWHLIGWNNVNEMTRMGMPGVFAWGTFDTWSPGYLMFMAATHNGISRLYETFGNGGSADTEERTLSAPTTRRAPGSGRTRRSRRVRWSLRNNNNYQQTGLLISLNHFANNRIYFLRNFYDKSKRSILKAKVEGPAAYVFPANDPRPGSAGRAAARAAEAGGRDLARDRGVHGDDAGASGAGRRAGRPWRRRCGRCPGSRQVAGGAPPRPRRAAAGADDARVPGGQLHRPHGPAVLAHRRRAARLPVLVADRPAGAAVRRHRVDVPRRRSRVQAVRVTDVKVLDVPMELVKGEVKAPSGVTGTGTTFAINHNADNALITLRYRLKDADIQIAEEPFESRRARSSIAARSSSRASRRRISTR